MKKIVFAALATVLAVSLFAQTEEIEKKGFLTTKWCVKNDLFKDCRLESAVCGFEGCFKEWDFGDPIKEELVLYVHDEGMTYNIKLDKIKRSEFDEALNRNEVTIIGSYDRNGNTIHAEELKAPPPPKKSFFKGCL